MSRIVRNTTAVTTALAANIALSFIQIKLLTRWLPQAELGEYFATVALGAIISVLAQIGLPMVVLRFTAKYDALNDVRRIQRLVRFAWALVMVLATVLLLVERRVLPGLLPRIYEHPPACLNVLLATAIFVMTALRQVTYSCYDGLRRMIYPAIFENLNIGVITLCIVFMRHELSLLFLLQLSLTSGAVFYLISSTVLLRVLRRFRRQRETGTATGATGTATGATGTATGATGTATGDTDSATGPRETVTGRDGTASDTAPLLPDILPFWSGAALSGLVGICLGYADKFLVSLFLPFHLVSVFFVAERLTFLMKRLLALPLQVASPEITRRWVLGFREELRLDLGFMMKVQLALAMLVASVAFVLAELLVLLVSSPTYLEAAGVLRILSISVMLMGLYSPITTFLRAIERIHLALISDVLWITLYLGGGALLVPRLGLAGIGVAQVVASTVTAVVNLVIGQRVARIVWDVGGVVKIAILGVAVAVGGAAALRWLGPLPWFAGVPIGVVVVLVFHLLIIWSGALTGSDRARFRALAGASGAGRLIDRALFWPMRSTTPVEPAGPGGNGGPGPA